MVATKPLILSGNSLHVNVNAAGDGQVRTEIIDGLTGEVLPGYSMAESVPVEGDQLDAELRWTSGAKSAALAGRTVQLRFSIRKASLYAFWTR
jgi:hypothetical protein